MKGWISIQPLHPAGRIVPWARRNASLPPPGRLPYQDPCPGLAILSFEQDPYYKSWGGSQAVNLAISRAVTHAQTHQNRRVEFELQASLALHCQGAEVSIGAFQHAKQFDAIFGTEARDRFLIIYPELGLQIFG